jgi:Mn2+/Fe2+ NRAMP family transporter
LKHCDLRRGTTTTTATIRSAADVARALRLFARTFPNSGELAKMVFAVGVIGMGLLGIPVLAGSASYALTELLGWREGYGNRVRDARGFYGIVVLATVMAACASVMHISLIK